MSPVATLAIPAAATLRTGELARAKRARGERVISLGLGEPEFATPRTVIEATRRALDGGNSRYSPAAGIPELRERVAAALRRHGPVPLAEPENVIVTPGAKAALFLALRALLRPGDEVAILEPCYVSYRPQVALACPGAVVRGCDLRREDFAPDWNALATVLGPRTRAVITNFPNNPTGRLLSPIELSRLGRLLADKAPDACVVADEVYDRLDWGGVHHTPVGSDPHIADRTITIGGMSKWCAMTGWRLGWLVAPPDIVRNAALIQQHLNTCTCTFIQQGACAAFDCRADWLDRYRRELDEKAWVLGETARANPRLGLVPPQGGLFAFLNISATGLDSDEFAARLLEDSSVIVTPGVAFGAGWGDHVRVSLCAAGDEFRAGVSLLDRFVRRLP